VIITSTLLQLVPGPLLVVAVHVDRAEDRQHPPLAGRQERKDVGVVAAARPDVGHGHIRLDSQKRVDLDRLEAAVPVAIVLGTGLVVEHCPVELAGGLGRGPLGADLDLTAGGCDRRQQRDQRDGDGQGMETTAESVHGGLQVRDCLRVGGFATSVHGSHGGAQLVDR
jgi:hypothetical protein